MPIETDIAISLYPSPSQHTSTEGPQSSKTTNETEGYDTSKNRLHLNFIDNDETELIV